MTEHAIVDQREDWTNAGTVAYSPAHNSLMRLVDGVWVPACECCRP